MKDPGEVSTQRERTDHRNMSSEITPAFDGNLHGLVGLVKRKCVEHKKTGKDNAAAKHKRSDEKPYYCFFLSHMDIYAVL